MNISSKISDFWLLWLLPYTSCLWTQICLVGVRHAPCKLHNTQNGNHQDRNTLKKTRQGQLKYLGFEWLQGCIRNCQTTKNTISKRQIFFIFTYKSKGRDTKGLSSEASAMISSINELQSLLVIEKKWFLNINSC